MARGLTRTKEYNPAGEVIRGIMYERGITVSDLSRASGVNRCIVHYVVYEGLDTSALKMARICNALNVSMDYVMGMHRA